MVRRATESKNEMEFLDLLVSLAGPTDRLSAGSLLSACSLAGRAKPRGWGARGFVLAVVRHCCIPAYS